MKKISFCGIFATLFVATTIVLLASCSQDDDYYDSDMYTLAERGTRLGDPEPVPTPKPKKEYTHCVCMAHQTIHAGGTTISDAYIRLNFTVNSAFTELQCQVEKMGNITFETSLSDTVWSNESVRCNVTVIPYSGSIEGTRLSYPSVVITKKDFGM